MSEEETELMDQPRPQLGHEQTNDRAHGRKKHPIIIRKQKKTIHRQNMLKVFENLIEM